jgi:hypothetical protein
LRGATMKKMDMTKPYAQIYGDTEGRAFEQAGDFFQLDGSEWSTTATHAVVTEVPLDPLDEQLLRQAGHTRRQK